MFNTEVRFIDLFAGIGGIRKGFELACIDRGLIPNCVFTSEIKPHAVKVLQQNHPNEAICGDITQTDATSIPDFDVLLAGFPCQAFSAAGKRLGFADTRGTLFFDVERIMDAKKPSAFILENVPGLVNHARENPKDPIGRTLSTILLHLEHQGYHISWKVLNATQFGVPQERKRIYIVGTKDAAPDLDSPFERVTRVLDDIIESGKPTEHNEFVDLLLSHYDVSDLPGKAIKDKRGGDQNIHSWDLERKGPVSQRQKQLLDLMLKERRKKKWAEEFGIKWMDGMPLTESQISTFFPDEDLHDLLQDLTNKGYLKQEHPKALVDHVRVQDPSLPLGYNIVTGKMSFPVNKILDPHDVAPTLVAMDMDRLYVVDGEGLRKLTLREGLRLFGYPDDFKFDIDVSSGYDLLGNTVVVPVIRAVSDRVLDVYRKEVKA